MTWSWYSFHSALFRSQFHARGDDVLVALVGLARSLGVAVERLRVRTTRQVSAMRELIAEVVPGVVVFGPERGRLSRRLTRRLVEALRRDVDCLVWLPA